MKPILQSVKILSYLAYGAPWLVFLLPFVGQDWSLEVWQNTHKLAFLSLYVFLLIRLKIHPNEKVGFAWIAAMFGSFAVTGVAGLFAYSNRSHPMIACLDSLTLIVLYAILIGFAPRLRNAYDRWKGPETKKVPFELNAETFRLPNQSADPAEYPRPSQH